MNKKLEDTFDLPSMEEALENSKDEKSNSENKEEKAEVKQETVIGEVK